MRSHVGVEHVVVLAEPRMPLQSLCELLSHLLKAHHLRNDTHTHTRTHAPGAFVSERLRQGVMCVCVSHVLWAAGVR
jgi:hypothetical protein